MDPSTVVDVNVLWQSEALKKEPPGRVVKGASWELGKPIGPGGQKTVLTNDAIFSEKEKQGSDSVTAHRKPHLLFSNFKSKMIHRLSLKLCFLR